MRGDCLGHGRGWSGQGRPWRPVFSTFRLLQGVFSGSSMEIPGPNVGCEEAGANHRNGPSR